jgi:hypothetical protein
LKKILKIFGDVREISYLYIAKQKERIMKQKEIISFFNENGGLRCKYWSLKEIYNYIKETFPKQRVSKSTYIVLKRTAEIYQK